jgi:hypothetical protein
MVSSIRLRPASCSAGNEDRAGLNPNPRAVWVRLKTKSGGWPLDAMRSRRRSHLAEGKVTLVAIRDAAAKNARVGYHPCDDNMAC